MPSPLESRLRSAKSRPQGIARAFELTLRDYSAWVDGPGIVLWKG